MELSKFEQFKIRCILRFWWTFEPVALVFEAIWYMIQLTFGAFVLVLDPATGRFMLEGLVRHLDQKHERELELDRMVEETMRKRED